MVKKTIKDYYEEIIQMVPDLQKIPEKQAHAIILEVIRYSFREIKDQMKQDPYTVIDLKKGFENIYVNNEKAYRYKKKKFLRENLNALYKIADLDETRLYPEEYPIVEEREDQHEDQERTQSREDDCH